MAIGILKDFCILVHTFIHCRPTIPVRTKKYGRIELTKAVCTMEIILVKLNWPFATMKSHVSKIILMYKVKRCLLHWTIIRSSIWGHPFCVNNFLWNHISIHVLRKCFSVETIFSTSLCKYFSVEAHFRSVLPKYFNVEAIFRTVLRKYFSVETVFRTVLRKCIYMETIFSAVLRKYIYMEIQIQISFA